MEGLFGWINGLLGGATLLLWGWVAASNWQWVWMGFTRRSSGSPVLLLGPVFSMIGVGFLVRSGIDFKGFPPWGLVLACWFFDPGALPLLIVGLWRRFFRRTSKGSSREE